MYSEKVLEHFQRPRNAGTLERATVNVGVSNPVCGDELRLSAIVVQGVVEDVRFLCRGCTASIACASWSTERIKGLPLREVGKISAEEIAEALGGLPKASFHAAQLAADGLRALEKK
jgi:nitrogen fixation protein NifU and related proteins